MKIRKKVIETIGNRDVKGAITLTGPSCKDRISTKYVITLPIPRRKNKIQWFESNEKLAPKKNKKGVAHAIANNLVQNPVLISPILFAIAILNKSANPIIMAPKIPKTILTTIDLSNKFTHAKLIH